jgi:hypothetical protein
MFSQIQATGMIAGIVASSEIPYEKWYIGQDSSTKLIENKKCAAYFDVGNSEIAKKIKNYFVETHKMIPIMYEAGRMERVQYVILYTE